MKLYRLTWVLLVTLLLPLSLAAGSTSTPSSVGSAQKTPKGQQTRQGTRKPVQVPKLSKDAIRVFLDKIEVAGRVEKPQAIFIIPGRSPEVEDVRIDRSFFKEIFRKVEMPTGARKKVRQMVRPDLILW